jgi:transketolase
MRNAFAQEVTTIAARDERVVLLSGDIGNRLFNDFKARFPTRFHNCGVAEQNMIGVAAGLALSGLRPVVYTIAPFTTYRCLEQVRVDLCYHRAPVVIAGVGAGLGYAPLGATHHSCEDVACLRALPGMTVVAPADPAELRAALRAALTLSGPAYLRLGKKGEPAVHAQAPEFQIGRSITLRQGPDAALLCCGTLLPEALEACDRLARRGVGVRLESVHTLKPLDQDMLEEVFRLYSVVVCAEEHSVIGGLGAAVAQWLVQRGREGRGRLVCLGTPDAFLERSYSQAGARQRLGLDALGIADAIADAIQRQSPPSLPAAALGRVRPIAG